VHSKIPEKLTPLLKKLKAVRQVNRNQWEALCPAHADSRASLSISLGKKGNVLIHCHAGCDTVNVVKAIGMTMLDLRKATSSRDKRSTSFKGRITATYDFCDIDGTVLFQEVRFEPKRFCLRKPKLGGGWENTIAGCKEVPFRLPDLANAKPKSTVFVVEGCKDAERLHSLGLIATCNAMGAGKWHSEHAQYLSGHHVVICPDNDAPGKERAEQVARSLVGKAISVKVVTLPNLTEKQDISDWLDAGGNKQTLSQLVKRTDLWQPSAEEKIEGTTSEQTGSTSQATQLLALAEKAELFRDPQGAAFARFPINGHYEIAGVRQHAFKQFLARSFYEDCRRAVTSQAKNDALSVLEAEAHFGDDTRNTYVRVGELNRKVYVDLADEEWRAVEIDEQGWRIVSPSPVMFRRPKGMLPLPPPICGGEVKELLPLINVSRSDWPLVAAWLVAALRYR
jgi:5S rRNA maturation endonuclease (ribonuclease M5)